VCYYAAIRSWWVYSFVGWSCRFGGLTLRFVLSLCLHSVVMGIVTWGHLRGVVWVAVGGVALWRVQAGEVPVMGVAGMSTWPGGSCRGRLQGLCRSGGLELSKACGGVGWVPLCCGVTEWTWGWLSRVLEVCAVCTAL
jgi:hypothetical protein